MKNLLIIFLLASLATLVLPTVIKSNEANAQLVTTLIPTAAKDTLTNVDTATIYVASTQAAAISGTVATDNITRSVTVVATKVSGTVAGGVRIYGSNDGTNWQQLRGHHLNQGASTDTLALADVATNSGTFKIRDANGDILFRQYKVVFVNQNGGVIIPKLYLHRRSN